MSPRGAAFELERFGLTPVTADVVLLEVEGRLRGGPARHRPPRLLVEPPYGPQREHAPVASTLQEEVVRVSFAVPTAEAQEAALALAVGGLLLDLPAPDPVGDVERVVALAREVNGLRHELTGLREARRAEQEGVATEREAAEVRQAAVEAEAARRAADAERTAAERAAAAEQDAAARVADVERAAAARVAETEAASGEREAELERAGAEREAGLSRAAAEREAGLEHLIAERERERDAARAQVARGAGVAGAARLREDDNVKLPADPEATVQLSADPEATVQLSDDPEATTIAPDPADEPTTVSMPEDEDEGDDEDSGPVPLVVARDRVRATSLAPPGEEARPPATAASSRTLVLAAVGVAGVLVLIAILGLVL